MEYPTTPRRHGGRHERRKTAPEGRRVVAGTIAAVVAVLIIGVVLILAVTAGPGVQQSMVVPQSPSTSPTTQVEATAAPEPEPEPEPEPIPEPPMMFDAVKALDEVRAIEAYGVRKGGSDNELEAANHIAARLSALGYAPQIETFPLPNGRTSRNVIARSSGSSGRVVVLGAHMDSKDPSPGANDNGTGCGALLEIARILASQPATTTVEFVFFGTEEMVDKVSSHHHYGSRYRVKSMTAADRANTAGMISVDMIGYGPDFCSRTMLRGPQSMSDLVLAQAAADGIKMKFLKDAGSSGWSDHEAYEVAGIPATWIEWRDDPVYHTKKDTSAHLDAEKVRVAGQLTLDVVRSLDEAALERLIAR